jgi:hypothetical protein
VDPLTHFYVFKSIPRSLSLSLSLSPSLSFSLLILLCFLLACVYRAFPESGNKERKKEKVPIPHATVSGRKEIEQGGISTRKEKLCLGIDIWQLEVSKRMKNSMEDTKIFLQFVQH